VLVDANIFVYSFGGLSRQCNRLIARIETGDVLGSITRLGRLSEDSLPPMAIGGKTANLHTEAADDLPPMAIGGKTANLWPWQRFAVIPPTSVGGKRFLGGVV